MSDRIREIVMLTAVTAAVAVIIWATVPEPERAGEPSPTASGISQLNYDTPFVLDGIREPPVISPDTASVPGEAEVIGVQTAGGPRAYLVQALSPMTGHVVNDLVGEAPVTVTYCGQTDCIRVFAGDVPGVALDLGTGGWQQGEMALRWQGQHFPHTSSEIPFADHPFERTTWDRWRQAHPQSEIYVGLPPAESDD